jgi:plasmid stability protein
MQKAIRIRNVPEDLHRKLKARAALESLSLSDYLLREIRQAAERPAIQELSARLASRSKVQVRVRPAEILREERNRRRSLLTHPPCWSSC